MYDLINKKKRGGALSDEEIHFAVTGFTGGEIPDYQMSALLMAIYFTGMDARETATLTMVMAGIDSLRVFGGVAPEPPQGGTTSPLDPRNEKPREARFFDESFEGGAGGTFSKVPPEKFSKKNITVDKHSTGGVGDKTTLAVVPIVAACGVPVAKMSGRGLGHTGGTIDKLEAIPGFRTTLSSAELGEIVRTHGLCIAGQSSDLAPADKKIYALRDATATVDSIPLIAASIMSKKIAAGADAILLDVKTGNGAFMKNLDDARALADAMVEIGKNCGRKTVAMISDMSAPLGRAVGNALEVREVVSLLAGELTGEPLCILCEELAAHMLLLAEKGDIEECKRMARNAISSGAAMAKFRAMIAAQGGDCSFLQSGGAVRVPGQREDGSENRGHLGRETLCPAAHIVTVNSPQAGFVSGFDTEGVGIAAMILGAGRERPEDEIDYAAGIILRAERGTRVKIGDPLAELHTSNADLIPAARKKFLESVKFSQTPPEIPPLIF